MPRLRCPHCLEIVEVENETGSCPICARGLILDGSGTPALPDYVAQTQESPTTSPHIQEYVRSLEKQARIESERKPYHRKRAPVDLIVGIILIIAGLANAFWAVFGEWGLMSTLVKGVFPAIILVGIGGTCIFMWRS